MQIIHHSHEAFYRSPFGAVPCGATLMLRLRVWDVPHAPHALLRVWAQDREHRIPMRQLGAQDGAYLFEAELAACGTPCLMWYRFEVLSQGEHVVYGNASDHLGGEGCMGTEDSFQITVYDPAYRTPEWMHRGNIYQIMVDRFYNGDETGELIKTRADVTLHADWYEQPSLEISSNGDNYAHDFFGGNLRGVQKKLAYLKDLGVTAIYFNPIFRAASNHKYDTCDYRMIDPMFGTETDFDTLCTAARAMGIRILLDGVFSHVGDDSIYFNRYGHHDVVGACQSKSSPYYNWFTFTHYPDAYECWWGFDTLPNVREDHPDFTAYILTDEDAVIKHYLRHGASGWRLDVADELPMAFLRTLRREVKSVDPQAAVLGEVWEDASNKVAYGEMRPYVLGDTLDSVMNYPLRDALIDFLLFRENAMRTYRRIVSLLENYPKPFLYSLMNLLGSHDRARIVNVLCGCSGEELPRSARATLSLTPQQRTLGMRRTRLMLRFIASMPGMTCVYYGDEALSQGCADPFCRGTYPWGREDASQLTFFRGILRARLDNPVLLTGECRMIAPCADVLGVIRTITGGVDALGDPAEDGVALTLINRSETPQRVYLSASDLCGASALRCGEVSVIESENGAFTLTLGALDGETYLKLR